ncbi:transcription factor S [Candidatus Woesearchaeota archaeon]|nr:MAG: transcription factor S [Candidatus Woesearchaeota archaeon]
MMFCPKCKSLMMPKKEGEKVLMACSCGYTNKKAETTTLKEEMKETEDIQVVSDEPDNLPLTEAECEKCGHGKAYWWVQQTRASDEPETKFLKCEKCKYTWRDYD